VTMCSRMNFHANVHSMSFHMNFEPHFFHRCKMKCSDDNHMLFFLCLIESGAQCSFKNGRRVQQHRNLFAGIL
jgi:hypothetical protein